MVKLSGILLILVLLVCPLLEAKKTGKRKVKRTRVTQKEKRGLFLAPDFMLLDDTGAPFMLSQVRGKKVALYFYPKDNTSVCTKQACSIRDGSSKLRDAGIEVIGLSYGSHRKFKSKHRLPFRILQLNKQVIKLYNAQGWFGLPKRVTFLINERGWVVKVIKKIDARGHADQIIAGFAR